MLSKKLIYIKDLIIALSLKELKSKYKSTTLGFLWLLINPLIQMAALTLVFSIFLKLNIKNYPVFVFSGLLPWTYFSLAIQSGTGSLIANRDLIKKTPFPREVLPVSSVLAHLFTFMLSLLLLIIFSTIISGPTFNYLLLIPIIILETILCISISLLLSSFDIYYRDVSFILQAVLTVWFYITSIIYPYSLIPKTYQFLYNLNPMVGIITAYQSIFLKENVFLFQPLLFSVIESLVLLLIAIIVFKKRSKYFADWV